MMREFRHVLFGANMKIIAVLLFILILPSAVFAAEEPKKPIDWNQLIQDIRDLDSSQDKVGDHVVGEQLC